MDKFPNLDIWETTVYKYALALDTDQKIEVSKAVCDAMFLEGEGIPGSDNMLIELHKYKEKLFEQGHVTALILIYAHLGMDKSRMKLTEALLDYAIGNYPEFKEWNNAAWIPKLLSGDVSLHTLCPLITKWIHRYDGKNIPRCFQYILPLYLCLGDYKLMPVEVKELKLVYYAIIASTCHIGDSTFQDVLYDTTLARRVFREMVLYADRLFAEDKTKTPYGKLVTYSFKDTISTSRLKQVGNWLAFGAYITLMSKYSRYTFDIPELCDTKKVFMAEISNCLRNIKSIHG